MGISFEWHKTKAARNAKKHGVSFEEASTVFRDPLSVTIPDPIHSSPGQERLVLMGQSALGRLLVVVHSESGEVIRIISARRATRPERKQYEEA